MLLIANLLDTEQLKRNVFSLLCTTQLRMRVQAGGWKSAYTEMKPRWP